MNRIRAFISGCEATVLSDSETAFFREMRPCGLILFKRNCETPDQIRQLAADFRAAVNDKQALILIDQEGGRVQRLGSPAWRKYPSARSYGNIYDANNKRGLEAAKLGAQMIASDLRAAGINVNCAPVLDLPVPGSHDIIGDRAYGKTVEAVSALGRAVAEGYLVGGVLPVIKHMPGHGRALVDSHAYLPEIDCGRDELCRTDFAPFKALADMPLGMTAHVLIPDIDAYAPASTSPTIIDEVIRGEIGFDGLLMSDDIGMEALSGPMYERTRSVLDAGCDVVLHCNGDFEEMEAVAAASSVLSGDPLRRFEAARKRLQEPEPFDKDRAVAMLTEAIEQRLV